MIEEIIPFGLPLDSVENERVKVKFSSRKGKEIGIFGGIARNIAVVDLLAVSQQVLQRKRDDNSPAESSRVAVRKGGKVLQVG